MAMVALAEAEAAEAEAAAADAKARAARARARAAAARLECAGETAGAAGGGESKLDIARTRSTRWRRRVPWPHIAMSVGIVSTCAALATSGLMVRSHFEASADREREARFVAAARGGVEALLSIDYSTAQADVQRVIDASAGSFRDDFASNAEEFIKAAQESKSVSKGTVNTAALETETGDSATVAVAATSQVSNVSGAQQDPRAWRMTVTVVPDGGQLKMSDVEFVP